VLGVQEKIYPGWKSPEDAFNEWKEVTRGRMCDYSGMTYDLIEQHGGIQWPFGDGSTTSRFGKKRDPKEDARLYEDGEFQTEDGKAKLWSIDWIPPAEQPDREFPFWLNTGRTVEHWHTRTKTGEVPILSRLSPEAWVEMNARDAKKYHFIQGDYVQVDSRRGSIQHVVLRVTETVAPGQLFIPFHFAEANVNNLTLTEACPISREPNYKQCAVKIKKSEVPLLQRKKMRRKKR